MNIYCDGEHGNTSEFWENVNCLEVRIDRADELKYC